MRRFILKGNSCQEMHGCTHTTFRSLRKLVRNQNLLTVESCPEVTSIPLCFLNTWYLCFLFGQINWFPFECNWRNLRMPVQGCAVQAQAGKFSVFICRGNFCEIRKAMVANTFEQAALLGSRPSINPSFSFK